MPTAPQAVLATGASEEFARCLVQLLFSLERTHDLSALRVIAFDLGLTPRTRAALERRFAWLEWVTEPVVRTERALFGWKPRLFEALFRELDVPLLWVDSATVFLHSSEPIYAFIRRTGLYTPRGGAATMGELTHPLTLARLSVPLRLRSRPFVAGAFFGADPQSPVARSVVSAWARWAADLECLAPVGANLANHRYDQSLLSIAVYTLAGASELTGDELDISSTRPCALYRARNKVPGWLPWWTDPLVRAGFAVHRSLDVAAHRMKRLGRGPETASASTP